MSNPPVGSPDPSDMLDRSGSADLTRDIRRITPYTNKSNLPTDVLADDPADRSAREWATTDLRSADGVGENIGGSDTRI